MWPRTFTIRAKLLIAFVTLVGLTVAVAVLSIRSSDQARFLLERSRHAHAVLEQYLALRADMLGLFKQVFGDQLANRPAADLSEDGLRAALRDRVSALREALMSELTFVAATDERESEQDELRGVVEIEDEIRVIRRALRPVSELARAGRQAEVSAALASVLDDRVDGRLAKLLDAAIAEEEREVTESDRSADAALRRAEQVTAAAAVAAVLVGAATLLLIQRQVRRPLERLLAGTLALGRGEFDHRIPATKGDELSLLAAAFNGMADRVERGRRELMESRDALEAAVRARTEELSRANAGLTRADQIRRRFFADISHELRTPLTVIRGESEIALRGQEKSGAEYRLSLERVRDQASSLGQLVEDLLFVARADAGAARVNRQTVNLASILRWVGRDGIVLGREAGVGVELREHVAESSLAGDPGKLRQLFLLLVDNAVRYSRPGGLVTIDLSPSPRGLAVRVADEGLGIPPEEVDIVFERFRRGGNAPLQGDAGSGLGLPVAKAIVEAHGGEINLESVLDHGTVVTVVLPATGKLKAIA